MRGGIRATAATEPDDLAGAYLLAFLDTHFVEVGIERVAPAMAQQDGAAIVLGVLAHLEYDTVLDRNHWRALGEGEVDARVSTQGNTGMADLTEQIGPVTKA